jgi:hypothetical protein
VQGQEKVFASWTSKEHVWYYAETFYAVPSLSHEFLRGHHVGRLPALRVLPVSIHLKTETPAQTPKK